MEVQGSERAATGDALPGLVVYRFGASLYYANANRFTTEVRAVLDRAEGPPSWLCIEAGGIGDVDFSGGQTLSTSPRDAAGGHAAGLRRAGPDVRAELDRYGVTDAVGQDAYFDTVEDAAGGVARPPTGVPLGRGGFIRRG